MGSSPGNPSTWQAKPYRCEQIGKHQVGKKDRFRVQAPRRHVPLVDPYSVPDDARRNEDIKSTSSEAHPPRPGPAVLKRRGSKRSRAPGA